MPAGFTKKHGAIQAPLGPRNIRRKALRILLFYGSNRERSYSRIDLNLRGAFQHRAADALVSVGVVLAGLLGWQWIDPVLSLLIAAVIVLGTWSLFRQSLPLMFERVTTGDVLENALIFIGTVGIIDPLREEVAPAIADAHRAGIRFLFFLRQETEFAMPNYYSAMTIGRSSRFG